MKLPRFVFSAFAVAPLVLALTPVARAVTAASPEGTRFASALRGPTPPGWATGLGNELQNGWGFSRQAQLQLAWRDVDGHPHAVPAQKGQVALGWYTVQPGEAGFHALADSFLKRSAATKGQIELRVWVARAGAEPEQGEVPVVRTTLEAGELFDFDAFLGYLDVGDSVYVGVGTAGDPAGDDTEIDFRVVRAPSIPVSEFPKTGQSSAAWSLASGVESAAPAARRLAWEQKASGPATLASFRAPNSGYYAFHDAWVQGAVDAKIFVGDESAPRRAVTGRAGQRTSLGTDIGYVAKGALISLALSAPAEFGGTVVEWAPRRAPLRVTRGNDGYLDVFEPAAQLQAVDIPADRWITVPASTADTTEAIRQAFAKAAERAKTGGYAGVRLERGQTYIVASQQPRGRVFDLRGIDRVIFDGNGATLHIGSAEMARLEFQLFHLIDCKNMAFADFTATNAEVPFTWGEILEVTPRGEKEMTQTVTFRTEAGKLDPIKDIARNGRTNAYAYDPKIPGRLGIGTWTHYPATSNPPLKATDQPGVFTHSVTRTNNSIEPGMKWLVKNKNAGVIYLETRGTTENITLSGVEGRASGGGQLRFWHTSGINILNSRFEPDGDNWISSSADGVHGRAREGVWIEDTLIRGVCEDIMNTYGQNMVIDKDDDPDDAVMSIRMYERSSNAPGGRALRMPTDENVATGDQLVFFSPETGRVLGYAGVVSIKDGRYTLTNSVPGVTAWEEKQGRNVVMIYNTRVAGRFFVRDTRLMDSMRFGIYIKARGGVIFGTQFEGLSGPGVLGMNEPEWPEGPPPTHIWVQGCTFSQNNYGFMPRNRDYVVADPGAISIYTRHFRDPAVPDDFRAFVTRDQFANSHVKLIGNVFHDWRGMGISVRNARNVRIEDNLFLAPVDDAVMRKTLADDPALTADGRGTYAAIFLDSDSGVRLAGNRYSGLTAADRQVVQDQDVSGVVAVDNLARPAAAAPAVSLSFDEWFGSSSAEGVTAGRAVDSVRLGSATHRAGRLGAGLHFRGEAAATMASSADLTAKGPFTLALWAQAEEPAKTGVIFAQGNADNGAVIAIDGGRWRAGAWQGGVGAWLDLGPVSSGSWQHLGLTYDAAEKLHGYVDGVEIASAGSGGALALAAAGVSFGGTTEATRIGDKQVIPAGGAGFHGDVDEFRFFAEALAPADVSALALRRWP